MRNLKQGTEFGNIHQSQNLNRHSTSGASNKFGIKIGGRTSSIGDNERLRMNIVRLNENDNLNHNYENGG